MMIALFCLMSVIATSNVFQAEVVNRVRQVLIAKTYQHFVVFIKPVFLAVQEALVHLVAIVR